MNISAPFIRRPVMTSLIMLAILFFGSVAYRNIPVSALPDIAYPTITVSVDYPGASPQTMASYVASPLEQELLTIQGIHLLSSNNSYGSTSIICQFYLNVDLNVATQEVQQAINRASGLLPPDLPQNPVYSKTNPTDTPIIFIVLHSKYINRATLYEYGYTMLSRQLGTVEGVAQVGAYGFPFAIRINVDPQAMAAKGISLDEVSEAIDKANPDLPTGKLYGSNTSLTVSSQSQLLKAEEYNSIIIKTEDGHPVRLMDIGNAEDSILDDKESFSWWSKPAVQEGFFVLTVMKMEGSNTIEVTRNILDIVEEFKKQVPQSIEVVVPYVLSKWVEEAIVDVRNTLVFAFVLVVLVIFFYLGKLRNTIIPIITLPITLAGTFLVMYLMGFSENILSMSALTLSIGFLVDDAIIVLENIVRWAQKGATPYKAALDGSKQINVTILSISLCLAIVFLPLIFMGGLVGRIFHEFGMVIFIAILFSGFISLTLTPMLCSRFISSYDEDRVTKIERFSHFFNDILLKVYRPMLRWCLHHKIKISILGVFIVVCTVFLFGVLPRSFLPKHDLGFIQCFVKSKEGTSPKRIAELMNPVIKKYMEKDAIESIVQLNAYPNDNEAMFFMNLVSRDKRSDIWSLISDYEKEAEEFEDLMIFMKAKPLINLQVGGLSAGRAPYQYVLRGLDPKDLYSSAAELIKKMQLNKSFTEVSSNMEINSPTLFIDVLRDQGYMYGDLSALSIETGLKYAYGETYISTINATENQYYVILQLDPLYNQYPDQLSLLYLNNLEKQSVAINNVIESKVASGPSTINHLDGVTSVIISFDVSKGSPLSEALTELDQLTASVLADTVTGEVIGNTAAFQKAFQEMWWLLIVALLSIYLVLGMLYEDFLLPVSALSALPTGALGALLTLLILDVTLSLYAFIGIVMLLGIVMKNGILIVEFAVQEIKERGYSDEEAVFNACITRFRPILMTTLAAVMGALPIAIGFGGTIAKGREPLGIVIVGGLVFSQITTLFITPVAFLMIQKLGHWVRSKTSLFDEKEW